MHILTHACIYPIRVCIHTHGPALTRHATSFSFNSLYSWVLSPSCYPSCSAISMNLSFTFCCCIKKKTISTGKDGHGKNGSMSWVWLLTSPIQSSRKALEFYLQSRSTWWPLGTQPCPYPHAGSAENRADSQHEEQSCHLQPAGLAVSPSEGANWEENQWGGPLVFRGRTAPGTPCLPQLT